MRGGDPISAAVASPVRCQVDLDAEGRHAGHLELPRSTNTSGWSSLYVPLVSIRKGAGPTVLVIGGVHGDEPEGQVAALNLARETRAEDVTGHLIVLPCLSVEASRAYTRLWPSGVNMNRAFPGSPTGSPAEQLADFVSRFLIERADVVIDMHSGGRTSLHLPWSEMHLVDDPEQRRRMVDGMLAWNTDYSVTYIDVAGSGLLTGHAEERGKVVIGTELGGGGHVTAEIHRIARDGLLNALRHFGVLSGEARTRADLGRDEAVILQAIELDDYLLAPASGLFEIVVDLGQPVQPGDVVGRIHQIEHPDREPELVRAKTPGIVCVIRAIATIEQGDCLCVIGRESSREELY
jgi:predicted deacylase